MSDIMLTTKYPFLKIDSAKSYNYRVIEITFNNEPPNPATPPEFGFTERKTLVYSFEHRYDYVPTSMFVISKSSDFNPVAGVDGWAFLVSTGSIPFFTAAFLDIEVTSTNVNFYILKTRYSTDSTMPNVKNTKLYIRCYICVEDLSGNSVP